MYELKCSCGLVCNSETKEIIATLTREHQRQPVIFWSNRTQRNATAELSPLKKGNLRESLEIDIGVVRYWQDNGLNRGNGNFVNTNVWIHLFRKNENTSLKFDVILY